MKIDNLKFVSNGSDSTVYHVNEDYVVKVYDKLMANLKVDSDSQVCLKLINRYVSDTLKASEIIADKWSKLPSYSRCFVYESEPYDITLSILPQGTAHVISMPATDKYLRAKPQNGQYVTSVGQKYVVGSTLAEIYEWYDWSSERNDFYESIVQSSGIKRSLSSLSDIIDKHVKIPFVVVNSNVKVILDKPTKTLHWIITDLANHLPWVYTD